MARRVSLRAQACDVEQARHSLVGGTPDRWGRDQPRRLREHRTRPRPSSGSRADLRESVVHCTGMSIADLGLPVAMPIVVYPDAGENLGDELTEASMRKLDALGGLAVHYGRPESHEAYLRRIGDARAILLGWDLPAEVMEAAPALELVVFTGIGAARFVDLRRAAEKGITVCNCPGYSDNTVAEHALALLLAAARHVPRLAAELLRGALEPVHDGHGAEGTHDRGRRLRRNRAPVRGARDGHRDAGRGLDPDPRPGTGASRGRRVRESGAPARRV